VNPMRTGPEPDPGPTPADPQILPVPSPPPHRLVKRLRRSRRDRVIGGVCGGLGRYLDVDPVLVRIAAVALTLSGGAGVLIYMIAWAVIPDAEPGDAAESPDWRPRTADRHTLALVTGAVLVVLGALLLARDLMPGVAGTMFWPLVVIAAGTLVLIGARR